MVTIRKCVFCGRDIEPGTGKMVVDHSGTVAFYCSSKCEKNVGLKRSPRKTKWTQAYRKEKTIRVQHLADKKSEAASKPKAEKPKAEAKAEKPKEVKQKKE
jgi:large subunit ribosomal protein L24e